MKRTTVGEVLQAVEGRLLCTFDGEAVISAVDTDSRKITAGSLFIPIKGTSFDGHDFIEAALGAGATACLTEREPERLLDGKAYILVDDTRLAMKRLAIQYRNKFDIPFIAVTGSVGKTTTKDMMASVLSQRFNVLKTEGNLNNDIGLPQMIFRLEEEHQCAVLELGMNHPGEIRYLAEIVRPMLVVITNIGDAHIENLGSRENTLAAKCEVFEYLDPDGAVIVNGDDILLRPLKDKLSQRVIFCGEAEDCDLKVEAADTSSGYDVRLEFGLRGEDAEIVIPAAGRHMIYPALFSAAAAMGFGISMKQIRQGISEFAPSKMRMNVKELTNGITLLDDAYNANPQSMKASLEVLKERRSVKRVAVLGDMLELGELSESAHRGIGETCAECGVDLLLTQGEAAAFISEAAAERGVQAKHCKTKMEVIFALGGAIGQGTTVLIKASRGMHFEEITGFIEEQYRK